ncbi:gamma-aminobutyric acid receptor subunit theta [Cavia porcellus]|uniref:gamma-aminobutyric acid receptor subunit theta n=1 Tax=Cavia porcellus TaxID=10141 RepID=UPI002FDFE2BB
MGFRAVLRVGVLMLLIRTWLADSDKPSPTPNFKFSRVPQDFLDIFNCKNCANQSVVHKILDRVLSKYDVRLRPNFGGAPVTVKVSIYVSDIHEISDMNMDYTMTMYFYQTWKDSRLSYSETDLNLTLDYRMERAKIRHGVSHIHTHPAWVHPCNAQGMAVALGPPPPAHFPLCFLSFGRLTAIAACSLDLRKFPMDQQTCKLEVESYGYTIEDIILSWENNEDGVQMTEELNIPQFNFLGKIITSKEVYFYTGSYMRLVMKFQVKRDIASYLLHVYWPTVLTTVLSWISFWMNHESSAARVTIGLTSILILTTIDSHLRDKLPHIAYVKAIDIYILVCLFFVFLSLVEYIYINYLFFNQGLRHRRRRRRARRLIARFLYHNVVVRNVQDVLINMENEVGSGSPTHPAQARLASPESLGSLATISEQVPLATSESLSTLSGLAQLKAQANPSHIPSIRQQALPGFHDTTVPTQICIRTEVHVHVEIHDNREADSKDNLGLDESHGHHPSGRPMPSHGQRCVPKAGWDFDKIESLEDDTSVKSHSPDLEEQFEDDDTFNIHSVDEENPMTSEQEDSGSESDDCCLLNSGCYCSEVISSKLFNPDHVPKIDKWCRVLFPVTFLVFNVVYWLYHIY